MMKLYVQDVAIEVLKTLISTDQRELIDAAERREMTTAKGVAAASFEFAEAFIDEYNERYSNE
jgi:hypothetical protein